MRDISDDEQRSYRRKSWLPFGLRRRRATGFVAAPYRCPASPASPRLALARRRSQRGPRDFHHGLLGSYANRIILAALTVPLYPGRKSDSLEIFERQDDIRLVRELEDRQ